MSNKYALNANGERPKWSDLKKPEERAQERAENKKASALAAFRAAGYTDVHVQELRNYNLRIQESSPDSAKPGHVHVVITDTKGLGIKIPQALPPFKHCEKAMAQFRETVFAVFLNAAHKYPGIKEGLAGSTTDTVLKRTPNLLPEILLPTRDEKKAAKAHSQPNRPERGTRRKSYVWTSEM